MQLQEILKERDMKLIGKYCQQGVVLNELGEAVNGVCRAVDIQELLNDLHIHDAKIYEAFSPHKYTNINSLSLFRKKPVVIEAVQFIDRKFVTHDIPDWIEEAMSQGKMFWEGEELLIKTLEGLMEVSSGDWIIQGVKGEIYPCKPDIFQETYEPA